MCAEIGRRDRDGGPHHRERGHAVAGLREHRGAILERIEIRPVHFDIGGLDGRDRVGRVSRSDRAQAHVLAHR